LLGPRAAPRIRYGLIAVFHIRHTQPGQLPEDILKVEVFVERPEDVDGRARRLPANRAPLGRQHFASIPSPARFAKEARMVTGIVSSPGADPGAIAVTLEVNGATVSLPVAPYVTLLDLLRE
jgi:hypothetical protein